MIDAELAMAQQCSMMGASGGYGVMHDGWAANRANRSQTRVRKKLSRRAPLTWWTMGEDGGKMIVQCGHNQALMVTVVRR